MISPYGEQIVLKALEIGAIKLDAKNPFRWTSGYFMPIYNNNRMLLFDPNNNELVTHAFHSKIRYWSWMTLVLW